MILKRKIRYILVESSEPLGEADHKELTRRLEEQLGLFGQLDANPKVLKQFDGTHFAIRVNRGAEGSVVLALCFLKSPSGKRIGLYTLKTSGTLRSLFTYCQEAVRSQHSQHSAGQEIAHRTLFIS